MKRICGIIFFAFAMASTHAQLKTVVFQSDFGLKDGAVAAMKGVAFTVDQNLRMFDLTHEIPAYNIWEAAYRLKQTAPYWPAGTVFVSVVDPGVGSERRSIVMKSRTGHYFVTPDNGTLTLVAEAMGVDEVRVIDESKNRLKNSGESYTFHGRDVYAYTAARLAAGVINFEGVGATTLSDVVHLPYKMAARSGTGLEGTIDILDVQYGNIWTNISSDLVNKVEIRPGDKLRIEIFRQGKSAYEGEAIFGNTFSAVAPGQSVAYLNSLMNLSLAINQGNFAERYKIGSGGDWTIKIKKVN